MDLILAIDARDIGDRPSVRGPDWIPFTMPLSGKGKKAMRGRRLRFHGNPIQAEEYNQQGNGSQHQPAGAKAAYWLHVS
jgi:hypothetical protein